MSWAKRGYSFPRWREGKKKEEAGAAGFTR